MQRWHFSVVLIDEVMDCKKIYSDRKVWSTFSKMYKNITCAWQMGFSFSIAIVNSPTFSCRENKDFAIHVKIPSPSAGSGRPATSPKELSSPRRPASRKGLERSATQTEIIKKESQARNVHLVSKKTVVERVVERCYACCCHFLAPWLASAFLFTRFAI